MSIGPYIGTTLYGKKDVKPDGSYVTTKWFVIMMLPIVPIGTYRVWRTGPANMIRVFYINRNEFKMEEVKPNWPQILLTFFSFWGFMVIIVGVMWATFHYLT